MNERTKVEEWHHILELNEQTFVSQIVEKAAQYLRNNRNEEGEWGYYKGLPIDIHASSLAIEALRICKSPEFETSAEDAAVRIKSISSCNLDTLGVQQLVDLLNTLSGTEPRDSELELKVMARLKDLRHDAGWGDPEPSISLSCRVILAFMKLENPPQDVIKQWVAYLTRCQRSDDGGWGATPDSKSAIIPTCQALRVLNRFSDESLVNVKSASIEFLRNYFQTKGWDELGDTFAISTVLRTLGEIEDVPFEIIQTGIDSLYERVNSDGGWGAVKGEPSNVEHTALSTIALSSAGENKFVPFRLVNATLETAESEIIKLRNERDRLSEDIDQRVKDEGQNIIKDRKKLQKEVNSYKEEVSSLESKVSEMRSELKAVKTKREFIVPAPVDWWTFIYLIVGIIIIIILAYTVFRYFYIITDWLFVAAAVVAIIAATVSFVYTLRRRQLRSLRSYTLGFGPERSRIVYELTHLLAEWPPSKREDFIFQLAKGGEDLSPDEFDDYAYYFSKKYGERESQVRQLQEIMYLFMRLPPSARLAVLDQVRMLL